MAQSTIDIEVKGLQELQRKMEQMVEDLHGAPVLQAMRDSTLMVQRDARIAAPVDTGRLRASIMPEVVTNAEELRGIVGSNVEYAPYVEYGTAPHIILPKNAAFGVLAFEWKNGPNGPGQYFFRVVYHPGTRPRPYLEPAFKKNENAIRARFDRAIEVIVNK